MSLSKYDILTWRVYPRVHYFYRRYHDLIQRFNRVINAFPKGFHSDLQRKVIEDIDERFGNGIKVFVAGHGELKFDNIVVTMKPLEERHKDLSSSSKTAIFISHIYNEYELQNIRDSIDFMEKEVKSAYIDWLEHYFIVIDTRSTKAEGEHDGPPSLETCEKDNIRREICKYLSAKQTTNVWNHDDRIVFGSNGSSLPSVISEFLEAKLIDGFYKVKEYLENFVRAKRGLGNRDIDILHAELVVKAIQNLLRDEKSLADIQEMAEHDESEETKGWSLDEKTLHICLKKLALLIKCAIVEPCSAKYSLPTWIVNLLLFELKFETKVVECMSKNTRYHLTKRLKCKKDVGLTGLLNFKFDFVIYPIQNDASKVISDAEKTMESASHIVTVMEKMIFEVEGYLEQTIVQQLKYEPKTPVPVIPEGLREAILRMKGVYGFGVVYNALEVHLLDKEPENKEPTSERERSVEETLRKDDTAKDEIHTEISADPRKDIELEPFSEQGLKDEMKKYGLSYPYNIRYVAQEPVSMMADIQHENGKMIKSPTPHAMTVLRSGTLGAFAEGNDKRLYALTCAHVVCNPYKDEHEVFIQDRGTLLKKIGVSTRRMTLCSGKGQSPVIDLAAVRVDDEILRHCIRRLRDDSGLNRKGKIAEESARALMKRDVYKYGAVSNLTRGLICSSEFGFSGTDVEDEMYVLLVEALPGSETTVFAKRGDSGSVICMPDLNSDDIKVVTMLTGGDYKVSNDTAPKYLTFLLKNGLKKMKDISSINLDIP